MLGCKSYEDVPTLYGRYVRDCVMLARFGTGETRRQFFSRYEVILGGRGDWLRNLPDAEQEQAFLDAVRLREGGLPRTRAGLRLALPRWFVRRVAHPLDEWEEAGAFRPTGLAVDPICHMCVDPGTTPYHIVDGDQEHYFCCPHCLALFGDRLLRSA